MKLIQASPGSLNFCKASPYRPYYAGSTGSTVHAMQALPSMVCSVYRPWYAVSTVHAMQCVPSMLCSVYRPCYAVCTVHAMQCLPSMLCSVYRPWYAGSKGCTVHGMQALRAVPSMLCRVYRPSLVVEPLAGCRMES